MAHDLRWRLLKALARSDCRVQYLAQLTGEPPNLVSYHLRQMRDLRLVTERRSAADGRDIYYALDLSRLHALWVDAGAELHPALRTPELVDELTQMTAGTLDAALAIPTSALASASSSREGERTPSGAHNTADEWQKNEADAPIRVLFLCTHNSARSQMAEGILRRLGRGHFEVFSAGSEPTTVHPEAISVMAEMGVDIRRQQAQNLDEFRNQTFSYVITLCDNLREICPTFNGEPSYMHWSFPDPTLVTASDEARRKAFIQTALQLFTRIRYLIPLIAQERQLAA